MLFYSSVCIRVGWGGEISSCLPVLHFAALWCSVYLIYTKYKEQWKEMNKVQ